ncbi:MAG: DNA (cytosine-5-)-methyltransferase [Candidatus Kapaibacteriota bacterium]
MKEIKNVLSLFDGMSCGQIALNRAGIKYENYFASEIDKYAITVTQANFPNTIQLGDIRNIKASDLPKIDLLIGGSPCQGFSFAGKQLNFEDERSKLFFEYVRLLNELKPKYFLLENVKMKKEFEDVISQYLGIQPVEINSNLVSAQNRRRLYWTNIGAESSGLFGELKSIINLPNDKGILLKDILESEVNEKYFLSEKMINYILKPNKFNIKYNFANKKEKALALVTKQDKRASFTNYLEITNPISFTIKKNIGAKFTKNNKTATYRRLTPIECERLQTVADNYTNHVSDSQRYKMLGNGWTIDVIVHIFSYLKTN